jgi:cytochrome P450
MTAPDGDDALTEHFDYLSHDLGSEFHAALTRLQRLCPVAHSDQNGGHWMLTRYEDVLGVAQDWQTWSSEVGSGVAIAGAPTTLRAIPEHVDPPLQRTYKRLINAWFTPGRVAAYEAPTRAIAARLVDRFVDAGSCDFQAAFARPFPGLAFFELVLDAPPSEATEVAEHATAAANPTTPDRAAHWRALERWVAGFLDDRRSGPRRSDVVDAVIHAEIEGRPITDDEIFGIVTLLILGGLDTTAGVLGAAMMRMCAQPEIAVLLRERPDRIPAAVEELLRLDGSFVGIGRTARHDTELGGCPIEAGAKVYLSWAGANRDETEFPDADVFDVDRARNRHLAFGAGPHRCAGSNLARLNLRVALHELVQRISDVELEVPAAEVHWHLGFARAPRQVPIRFTKRDPED